MYLYSSIICFWNRDTVVIVRGEGRKEGVQRKMYNKIKSIKIISEFVPYWGLFSKEQNTLYDNLKISITLFLNFSDCS